MQPTIVLAKTHLHQIQAALQKGYKMAYTTKDTLILSFDLPLNRCSIGVGGIIRKNNQILMVQEANGPVRESWAFPAGLLKEGETIEQGLKREIKEELGVESIFKSIIFFGEQANSRWGKQDFYFGCEIELLDENFTICQKELMGCKWWALDEVKALKLTPITKIGIPFIS